MHGGSGSQSQNNITASIWFLTVWEEKFWCTGGNVPKVTRDVPIRFIYPDPSPLIFSECRYWVLIRYLAKTNIFLDNTAALGKKKYLHPSCSFYFVETKYILSYGSLLFCICYCNIGYHFPRISRWVWDARPSCTASWSVCETQPTLVTSMSSITFSYSLCCHLKWRGPVCLSISHAFSIS